jgi:TPR repeat protein
MVTQCENATSGNQDEYDEETGYTESERFFQCLDYHRSLLFDYHRRWGPYLNEKDEEKKEEKKEKQKKEHNYYHGTINDKEVNVSAKWPRKIPNATEARALETDLVFCKRSLKTTKYDIKSSGDAKKCQDIQFRIAAYYCKLKEDEEGQRKGFKLVKELAEQGHVDGMCYYGACLSLRIVFVGQYPNVPPSLFLLNI